MTEATTSHAGDGVDSAAPALSEPDTPGQTTTTRRGPTIGVALVPLAFAWAVGIARLPVTDNSFFTHLATGRLILANRAVPTADPYSFTAPDTAWTVQSWLASVAYAGAEQVAGAAGLRVLVLALFVASAALLVVLSSAATSLLVRVAVLVMPLVIATDLWSARPYMVGFLGIGLVWLALEQRIPVWTLVPLLWVWANAHGSFPLAGVLAVAVLAGARLDGRSIAHETLVLVAIVIGTVASAIGPLLHQGLLFPLRTLTRSEDLQRIVEWRAPGFVDNYDRMFLLLVLAVLAGLVRRPTWRHAVPTLVFVAMALIARRNIVMALPVLVPVLSATCGDFGSLSTGDRPETSRIVAGFSAVMVVLALLSLAVAPVTALGGYPTRALALQADLAASGRLATQDFTGNLLEVLDGPTGTVFFDDRVDMYPADLVRDYQVLLDGSFGWDEVLDRYEIDQLIWQGNKPLAQLVLASDHWHPVLVDEEWVFACRRSTC